jgi:decaprenylphospho-beta-D-ribofuranose 2-oxidase
MKQVTGWGNSHVSNLDPGGRRYIPRGNAQAYNDASTLDQGAWKHAPKTEPVLDSVTGEVSVGAGLAVSELLTFLAMNGRTIEVVPGSGWASVGGMLASEVHGKNHHYVGTIASIVVGFDLESPSGVKHVSRDKNKDLFFATMSGMGLTGLITKVSLQTVKLNGTCVSVDRTKANLLEVFAELKKAVETHKLGAVASIDAYGGLALIEAGSESTGPNSPNFKVSKSLAPAFIRFNRLTVFAANTLRYKLKTKPSSQVSFSKWLYPLSAMPHWSKYHGRNGMWQYQISLSDSTENRSLILSIIESVKSNSLVTLTTLKYLGDGTSQGLLGFTQNGWTLAMDIKIPSNSQRKQQLLAILHSFDSTVADLGGRIYLTKDARALPSVVSRMYPSLLAWRKIVDREDPNGEVESDLSLRVGLRNSIHHAQKNTMLILGGNSTIAISLASHYESFSAATGKGLDVISGVRNPIGNQHKFDAQDRRTYDIMSDLKNRANSRPVIVVAAGSLSDGYSSETIANDPSWGVVEATAFAYESLKAAGGGTLVVLSSGGIAVPRAGRAIYVAGKAALDSYTRGLMEISQSDGIDVVLVRPSFVFTRMTENLKAPKDAITPETVSMLTLRAIISGGNHLVWTPPLAAIKYLVALLLPKLARKVLNKNHVERK